jgi:hypothetical protein
MGSCPIDFLSVTCSVAELAPVNHRCVTPFSSFGAPERNGATCGAVRRHPRATLASMALNARRPCSLSVGENSAPRVVGAPDARAQTFELDDLAVVDEQVDVDSVVLDVSGEDVRFGRLEHHMLETEL